MYPIKVFQVCLQGYIQHLFYSHPHGPRHPHPHCLKNCQATTQIKNEEIHLQVHPKPDLHLVGLR
jgi:hypothetical protein